MQSVIDFLKGKKTYLLCAAAFIYGGGIQIGAWGHYPFLDVALATGTLASLRAGIAKGEKPYLGAIVAAFCLLSFATANPSFGGLGTTEVTDPVPAAPHSSAWYNDLFGAVQDASAAKAIEVRLAPIFAPKLANHWGLSLEVNHPINNFVFVGTTFDFLDNHYYSGSANLGAQVDLQIFGKTFTPYTFAGFETPLGGAGDKTLQPGAIAGAGLRTVLWQNVSKGIKVSGFGELDYRSQYAGIQFWRMGAQLDFAW